MGRFIRKNRREGNKRVLSRDNDAFGFVQTAIWSFISSTKNRKMRGKKKGKKREKNQNTNK